MLGHHSGKVRLTVLVINTSSAMLGCVWPYLPLNDKLATGPVIWNE